MKPVIVLAGVAAVVALAGCSSSSSSTASGHVTSHPASTRPATVSGTERFSGTARGASVVANNPPTYPLTFTGPVATTGSFTPPNTNATHQTGVFHTAAGNMAVTAVVPNNHQPHQISGCLYGLSFNATYVVDGAKSTGRFAGAVGHGTAAVTVRFYLPKKNGQCVLTKTAKPLANGAESTLAASGPLTVKQQ